MEFLTTFFYLGIRACSYTIDTRIWTIFFTAFDKIYTTHIMFLCSTIYIVLFEPGLRTYENRAGFQSHN